MSCVSISGAVLIVVLLSVPQLISADDILAILTQPRDRMLVFRETSGQETAIQSVSEWKRRRDSILDAFQQIAGPFPGPERRVPLDVKVLGEDDCGTYLRRRIEYSSEPGGRTPAYLLIPKDLLNRDDHSAPAVLCLHPTNNEIGVKVVVGLGGKPNRQYASELAERGYVTLAPSYPLLADYQPDLKALGWESGTMKGIWDASRGLDLLDSLPFVRTGRYGVIGHSLGGHNAVFTALFDDRLQVVVSSCGLDSFLDYYGGAESVWEAEKGWTQTRYMPRLREYRGRLTEIPFDFPELIASLAPRRVLIIAPLHDSNFRHDSVDRIVNAARPVFELHAAGDQLQVEHPDCDHDFPPEMRERAYVLFDQVLKASSKEPAKN
jgi:dienelactone hydrolase